MLPTLRHTLSTHMRRPNSLKNTIDLGKKLLRAYLLCQQYLCLQYTVSFVILQEELKHKEEELSRAKKALAHDISTVSKDDEEVLLKRIEMTEGAHKAERDRSNLMEDVSA